MRRAVRRVCGEELVRGRTLRVGNISLFLDDIAPTAATAKYKDSASVHFSGGNPWVTIGTWAAQPALTAGLVPTLSGLHTWVGLKNSGDIGTTTMRPGSACTLTA